MTLKITSQELTTCSVSPDGSAIRLELVELSGNRVAVQLPFDQSEAVVMTLPRLLSEALKVKTGDVAARYVFPLGRWFVERAEGHTSLIVTLATVDGFQVAFSIPIEACVALGWALRQGGQEEADAGDRRSGVSDLKQSLRVN